MDNFVSKYNGTHNVGDTPENKGQCVGLVEVWFDSIGSTHVWGNAKDLYDAVGADYTKGTSWPAPAGSAGVMDASWGGGVGHTWLSLGDGRVFEQNNPTGSACKVSNYGAAAPKGYVGWILPNNYKGGIEMSPEERKDFEYWKNYAINVLIPQLADALEWKKTAIDVLVPQVKELQQALKEADSGDATKLAKARELAGQLTDALK